MTNIKKNEELEFDIEENKNDEYIDASMSDEDILNILSGQNAKITKVVPIKRLGIPFVVKSVHQKRINKIRKDCTKKIKVKGQYIDEFNDEKFNGLLLAYGIEKPKITPDVIEKSQCSSAYSFLQQKLLPGEINLLIEAITDCSGFNLELEEDILKNE